MRDFTGPVTLENLDHQFCSDWLKEQMRQLIVDRDQLKAECERLKSDYQSAMNCCEEVTKLRAEIEELRAVADAANRFDNYVCEFGLEQALNLGDLYQPLHDALADLDAAERGQDGD